MAPPEPRDPAGIFAEQLLRAGCALFDLAADLAEELPADAYPGEEPGAVVVEMVVGTIRTAFGAADDPDLERATELIDVALDRVLEHLRLAVELSTRMRSSGDEGTSRTYG